jgi:hypothetical protein
MMQFFRPVIGSFVVFFFAVRCHWELKRRPWFWLTIAGLAAIHIWTIPRMRWSSGWVPAKVWEGEVTIDLVAVFVIIALIEKLLHEGPFAPKPRKGEA